MTFPLSQAPFLALPEGVGLLFSPEALSEVLFPSWVVAREALALRLAQGWAGLALPTAPGLQGAKSWRSLPGAQLQLGRAWEAVSACTRTLPGCMLLPAGASLAAPRRHRQGSRAFPLRAGTRANTAEAP